MCLKQLLLYVLTRKWCSERVLVMLRASFIYLVSMPIYLFILVINAKKRVSFKKHIIVFLTFVYCLAVISVTLFPLPIQKSLLESRRSPDYPNPKHNLVPIVDLIKVARIANFRTAARTIGGNILLFMPLGVLLPVLNRRLNSLSGIFISGVLGSVTVEGAQLLISLILGFNYRTFDVDDIILNTLGVIIGYSFLCLLAPAIEEHFSIALLGNPSSDEREGFAGPQNNSV